jgi:hypothetical protein
MAPVAERLTGVRARLGGPERGPAGAGKLRWGITPLKRERVASIRSLRMRLITTPKLGWRRKNSSKSGLVSTQIAVLTRA